MLRERRIGAARSGKLLVACLFLGLTAAMTYLISNGWRISLGAWSQTAATVLAIKGQTLETGLTVVVLLLFGMASVASLLRLWRRGRDIVVLSPDGIYDRRITLQQLSWRAIQAVSKGRMRGEDVVVLEIEPAILETLNLPQSLRASRSLGLKGVPIRAQGLGIGLFRLRRLVQRYHREATAQPPR